MRALITVCSHVGLRTRRSGDLLPDTIKTDFADYCLTSPSRETNQTL